MLIIFILISVATAFSRKAFDKNRNRYLWGTIGVVSYFLAQVIAGVFIALIKPEWLDNNGIVMAANLIGGFSGIGVAYYILHRLSDPIEEMEKNDDLLDSELH